MNSGGGEEAKEEEEEEEEVGVEDIVPSSAALSVVQRWMGISDAKRVLEESHKKEDDGKPRPLRLGLGAKYLSHSKAVALTGGIERRLQHQLAASSRRSGKPESQQPGSAGRAGASAHKQPVEDSDDSEDGMSSRARSLGSAKRSRPGPAMASVKRPGTAIEGGGSGAGKRKKKKNNNNRKNNREA